MDTLCVVCFISGQAYEVGITMMLLEYYELLTGMI